MVNSPTNSKLQYPADVLSVPLLDVTRGNEHQRAEILEAFARIYDSGQFIGGPDCQQFEAAIAEYCQTDFAIGCASGSDALLLALMAGDVGPDDEVILPSFTFFATAGAVARLGATPVFADIDPATYNIAPSGIESLITKKTKAIIPVHLFGQCADMDSINEIAERHGILVIEDAAQAIGAKHNGGPAGSLGDIGCFSFYPTKNLGGMGDGGILTTNDEELSVRLRRLAAHGMNQRYYHSEVGINSRLDSMQAALLNIKLKHLPKWIEQRQQNAARYFELFQAAGLDDAAVLPHSSSSCDHAWNQFTLRVQDGRRDHLRSHLMAAKIGSEIYYPVPIHQQECFATMPCAQVALPETERASAEVLSLPIFPELTADEQRAVVCRIAEFFAAEEAAQPMTRRLAS